VSNAGQSHQISHSETLSGGAGAPGRDRGCHGQEHSVHAEQRKVEDPAPQRFGDEKLGMGF